MDHFARLDVSVKETSVCIVDNTDKIVREADIVEPFQKASGTCRWQGGARPDGWPQSGRATQVMPGEGRGCITNAITLVGLAKHHCDSHHRNALCVYS
jgi:hypothetical protein